MTGSHPISGHVFRFEGKRRPVWRAKYRLPDGRQVQKTIGPAWTARGRPPAGYWTKRTAEAWLRRLLVEAAAGTLPGMVRTGATVADACAEYLRCLEVDRQRKPSTLRDDDAPPPTSGRSATPPSWRSSRSRGPTAPSSLSTRCACAPSIEIFSPGTDGTQEDVRHRAERPQNRRRPCRRARRQG